MTPCFLRHQAVQIEQMSSKRILPVSIMAARALNQLNTAKCSSPPKTSALLPLQLLLQSCNFALPLPSLVILSLPNLQTDYRAFFASSSLWMYEPQTG